MRLTPLYFAAIIFFGAGCVSISATPKQGAVGGVFKSADKGSTWAAKNALPTAKGLQQISGVDVLTFAFDPQDPQALYIGTAANGLFYSYDRGESWQRPGGLTAGRVQGIAVHPKDKCTIFAALGNRVVKSTDCNRSYEFVYSDPRPDAQITGLAVDWFNPEIIWITTATGELLRSTDGGATWTQIKRFDDGVASLVISAGDSRRLWVALRGAGIQETNDAGLNWIDHIKSLVDFEGSRAFIALVEDQTVPGTLFQASRFGLLRSADGGVSWQKVNILTPPLAVNITSLAVNPKNGAEIYYTTATKLFRSKDGGGSWSTSDLPTSRVASALAVDPANESVIYLGVTAPKK